MFKNFRERFYWVFLHTLESALKEHSDYPNERHVWDYLQILPLNSREAEINWRILGKKSMLLSVFLSPLICSSHFYHLLRVGGCKLWFSLNLHNSTWEWINWSSPSLATEAGKGIFEKSKQEKNKHQTCNSLDSILQLW